MHDRTHEADLIDCRLAASDVEQDRSIMGNDIFGAIKTVVYRRIVRRFQCHECDRVDRIIIRFWCGHFDVAERDAESGTHKEPGGDGPVAVDTAEIEAYQDGE